MIRESWVRLFPTLQMETISPPARGLPGDLGCPFRKTWRSGISAHQPNHAMNPRNACERNSPDACSVGDWIRSESVPDWSIHERLHSFLRKCTTSPDPATAKVSDIPPFLFEQSSHRTPRNTIEIVWVRVE